MSKGIREHKVVVLVRQEFKRLFSITERKNGDLLISMHHATNYRPFGELGSETDPQIVHQHYSVHRSLASRDDLNIIKHTLKFADGSEITTPRYTRAIKQTGKLAVLFTRRASDLAAARYNCTKEKRDLLASYNPRVSTLYYQLNVCSSSYGVLVPDSDDIAYKVYAFEHFKVIVFWSFGIFPAHSSAGIAHQLTHPAMTDGIEGIDPLLDGHDMDWAILLFRGTRGGLHSEMIDLVRSEHPAIAEQAERMRNLHFVKH